MTTQIRADDLESPAPNEPGFVGNGLREPIQCVPTLFAFSKSPV
jgi:hypothetical protein